MAGKTCPRCEEVEPQVTFGRHKGGKGRKRTYCMECERDISKKRHQRERGEKLDRRRGAPARTPADWVTVRVKCYNHKEGCDSAKDFSMHKSRASDHHYWICTECHESGPPPERKTGFSQIGPSVGKGGTKAMSSDGKIFRPGDRGFKSRAKECTPPGEIKKKGNRFQGYLSDMVKKRKGEGHVS